MTTLYCIQWIEAHNALFNIIASLTIAAATITYVIYTIKLVKETRASRLQQLESCITIYLDNSEAIPNSRYIKVKNIGIGTAYDVKFNIIKEPTCLNVSLLNIILFKNGMKYFAANYEYKHFLIIVNPDMENLDTNIELDVTYRNAIGREKKETFNLDIIKCYGDGAHTPPDTYIGRIAYNLEKINNSLEKKA